MHAHLDFLAYVLNAGYLFIPLIRVKDVWDTLVVNPEACSADREARDACALLIHIIIIDLFSFVSIGW